MTVLLSLTADAIKPRGRAWLWRPKGPSASGPSAARDGATPEGSGCLSVPVPVLSPLLSLHCQQPVRLRWDPGQSSHPPEATHPSILFPNMATSFSFNRPQNCSWDFRNVSFHCVCSIMLPGGVTGLWKDCDTLVMGEWTRHTSPGAQGLGATGAQTERAGTSRGLQDRHQLEHRGVSHFAHLLCSTSL